MIYPFKCACGEYVEVYRPAAESDQPQLCVCGKVMDRVFTVSGIAVSNLDYFDRGLGIHVRSKKDIETFREQYKRKTGHTLEPIGDGDPTSSVPKKKEIEIPRGLFDNAISE